MNIGVRVCVCERERAYLLCVYQEGDVGVWSGRQVAVSRAEANTIRGRGVTLVHSGT